MCIVNSINFNNEIIASDKPVLLVYNNSFFGYHDQTKTVFRIMNLYETSLKVCVIDGNAHSLLTALQIKGSPTHLIFSQGHEVKRVSGFQDYETLLSFVSIILQDYQEND